MSASVLSALVQAPAQTLQQLAAYLLGLITGVSVVYPSGDATGATDAANFAAALKSGASTVQLAPGVHYWNAGQAVNLATQNGLTIRGAGPTDGSGNGAGATVVRPSAAVSVALTIDGTPFGGYVQSFRLEDLTFDMANMGAASIAVQQLQAFDSSFNRVRVINDSGKVGLYFGPGSYVSEVRSPCMSAVNIIGTGVNDPTTISIFNSDIKYFNATWCANVKFDGGAVQPVYYAGMTVVYLAANDPTTPQGIPNASGVYLILGGYISNADSFTVDTCDFEQGGGYPSTLTGAHGTLNAYPVFQVGPSTKRVTLTNPQFAGMYLYEPTTVSNYFGANLGGGTPGNIIGTQTWFKAGLWMVNAQAIRGFTDNGTTQSLLIDPSTGGFSGRYLQLTPASDGQTAAFTNAAGATFVGVSSNATVGNSSLFLNNGAYLDFYSDAGASQLTLNIQGSNGLLRGYNGSGTETARWTSANGTIYLSTGLYVGAAVGSGVLIAGSRQTGWTAGTGTANKGAFATYAGQTLGATYSQSAAQATDNAVKANSQRILALEQAIASWGGNHGLIGT